MRIDESVTIDASPEEIWAIVTDPEQYPKFADSITRWEPEGEKERGLGARYTMRMQAGSAEVGGLVEVVEWDECCDMAWTSITGIDQRGRWRLRGQEDGTTKVSLRLAYHAPGGVLGMLSDRVSAHIVRGNLRRAVHNLKAMIEGEEMSSRGGGFNPIGFVGQAAETVRVAVTSGLARPARPDKLARALGQFVRLGSTPAAGYSINATLRPNDIAIVDELGTLTFGEVHERTNALANAWLDAGLGEGDSIAIMCRNHRGFIEATVAASKLGAHALYLNTAFAGPQLTEVVQREKPSAIVYDQEFTELLEDAGKRRKRFIAWVDDDSPPDPTLEELIEAGDTEAPVPPSESGRVVILTSGTTGTPKGASRKTPDGLSPAIALLSRIPLKAGERTMIAAPLFHSWGFAHFTLGMPLHSTYVLQRKFDPEGTLSAIAQHECTSCPMVPVMLQRILELPEEVRSKYDTSSLRTVPTSGSALPGDLAIKFMDEFGDVIYNLYGSTEVAWATIATPADLRAAPGTAGKPPLGTDLRIYDENGRELPRGETGRIFVKNDMLFEGYTGGGGKDMIDGLMSSGDVGYLDDQNRLFVEGRDDDMIVSGGENVFPQEVEDLIARQDGVDEVAVIGVDDEKFGQRLKAYVVKKKGASVTEDSIKQAVKSNLARYKVPRDIEFIDELPRNATGKVLKRELKELHEDKEGATA
jgi:acyl-CoA synthetase (AMP-forming)/AMP-acid ligase II/ribosome-associated toxin RatA of RatAB toxin-antitoxin module